MKVLMLVSVVFAFSFAKAEWSKEDVALAVKINKYADENYIKAIVEIERLAIKNKHALNEFYKTETELIGDISEQYPPSDKPQEAPLPLDISVPGPYGTSIGTSFSGEGAKTQILSEDARKVIFDRTKDLIAAYNDDKTKVTDKLLIREFLVNYLHFNPDASPAQLAKDMDMIQLQALLEDNNLTEKSITQKINENIAKEINDLKNNLSDVESKVTKSLDEQKQQTEAVLGTAELSNAMIEELLVLEKSNGLKAQIAKTTNNNDLDKMIAYAQTCVSSAPHDACAVNKSQIQTMEYQREHNFKKDARYALSSSLNATYQLAVLLGDNKMADTVSKVMTLVETGQKMADLAAGLGTQTALAMMGDVTSMAGLAMSAMSMFGGGGGSDAAIMAELQAIKMAIEEMRKQMHERFDKLSEQVKLLGIGVNSKLDNTQQNIGVVITNQVMLDQLLKSVAMSITDLTVLQTNEYFKETLNDIKELRGNIEATVDQKELNELFRQVTVKFNTYLENPDAIQLQWQVPLDIRAEYITDILIKDSRQGRMGKFTVVDYLIQQSPATGTSSEACANAATSNLYFFNTLGSSMLPIFRLQDSVKTKTAGGAEGNKYLNYLAGSSVDPDGIQKMFDVPLKRIDETIRNTNECLNNYVTVDSEPKNVVTYLVSEFRNSFVGELNKVLAAAKSSDHFETLQRAVRDPNQNYFGESEKTFDKKFMHVNSSALDRREWITLAGANWVTGEGLDDLTISDEFYAAYSVVHSCKDGEPSLTFPRGLVDSIFPHVAMKKAIKFGFNGLRMCYKAWTQTTNPDATVTLGLVLFHPKMSHIQFEIPLAVPAAGVKMKITHHANYDGVTNGEPTFFEIGTYQLADLANYMAGDAATQAWSCTPITAAVNGCLPAGLDYAWFANYSLYNLNKASEDIKEFSSTLVAETVDAVIQYIKADLSGCYRQILLGDFKCKFGTLESYSSGETKADFATAQQILYTLKALTPVISSFHENVSKDERQSFLVDFGSQLVTPQQIILQSALQPGDMKVNLDNAVQKLDAQLASLGEKTNTLLYIDAKNLLDTSVYDSLKFYGEQTRSVMKSKELVAK